MSVSQTNSLQQSERMSTTKLPFVIAIVALILFVSHSEAQANVQFCNRTAAKTYVAIAYVEKDAPGTTTNGHRGVSVEGWWGLEPEQCKIVSDINAGDHWVYFYAYSGDVNWTGSALLCVSSSRFYIGAQFKRAGDECQAGYRLKGFRRINTAAKNHTHNLTG
jgi:uncharacterized membrane protein